MYVKIHFIVFPGFTKQTIILYRSIFFDLPGRGCSGKTDDTIPVKNIAKINMKSNYETPRLLITGLTTADAAFIFELVNSAGWIKFIGDRNIKTKEDAVHYIQKILANRDINYRIVRLREQLTPLGIVTFIKRDYLQHHDIGFAFLPAFSKQGYAFEATSAVLSDLQMSEEYPVILATTIRENKASIQLLRKLGFAFKGEINNGSEILHLYSVTKNEQYNPE